MCSQLVSARSNVSVAGLAFVMVGAILTPPPGSAQTQLTLDHPAMARRIVQQLALTLSLGDNTELGGTVGGGDVRWNFFTDLTVVVGGTEWVKNGKFAASPTDRK